MTSYFKLFLRLRFLFSRSVEKSDNKKHERMAASVQTTRWSKLVETLNEFLVIRWWLFGHLYYKLNAASHRNSPKPYANHVLSSYVFLGEFRGNMLLASQREKIRAKFQFSWRIFKIIRSTFYLESMEGVERVDYDFGKTTARWTLIFL